MKNASAYLGMFDILENYKSFLRALPDQVESVIVTLDLQSLSEYRRVLEPSIRLVVPIARNRLNSWLVDLSRTQAEHANVILFIDDLITLSDQLAAATATMTTAQRKMPLHGLDFQRAPFTLADHFKVIKSATIKGMVDQSRRYLNDYSKKSADTTFYLSNVTDSIPEIVPRISDFMKGAISIYARHKKIDLTKPHNDKALNAVSEAEKNTASIYKRTHSSAGDVRSYRALIDELLYRTTRIFAQMFVDRLQIREFETHLTDSVILLKELKYELQQV
ncbi:hypothetical protein [Pseudomonas sp.]|uniref:hypothetical protein n=1 Tax=Pseudomonas sp. TaxID=306 RepID=UPI0026297D4E|nr:hypothetical protein [Pseudomonas sp.]